MEPLDRIREYIPETIIAAVLFGVWRRLKLGRILVFLAASTEREVYRELYRERQEDEKEMKENEQGMHQYWKTQALDCHKELLKQIAALARERGDGSNCIS